MADTNTNNISLCVECDEEIFNPICPDCLAKEVTNWLEDQDRRVRIVVNKELNRILNNKREGSKCIICNSNKGFLCPYCFTELIYNQLKKVATKKELLEFLTFFNFDLEHTGYYKDKEILEQEILPKKEIIIGEET